MSVACLSPTLPPMTLGKPSASVTFVSPVLSGGSFAFARIKGNVCLVQVPSITTASTLPTVDVKVFRHEFITIFRLSEIKSLLPTDISILEKIDDNLTLYEEDSETVFLARDLVNRMRRMTDQRPARRYHMQQCRQR